MKKTIAVDIDDVLAANAEAFVEYSNKTWGHNLTPDDYDEHWADVWEVDLDEAARRATELHDTDIFEKHRHYADAVPVLTELSTRYRLIITTSRRKSNADVTIAWIHSYFGDIFSEILFAGIYDDALTNGTFTRTKSDLFADNDVAYVIDDQLKHCVAASDLGIEALLFGDYRWNRQESLPANITRCPDWTSVKSYFDGRKN